jgi:hypothetical protein
MFKIKGLDGQIKNDDIHKGVNPLGKDNVSIHVIFLCKVWKKEKMQLLPNAIEDHFSL